MKITMIHGQNHKGSSCHIGRMLAEKLADEQEITEFFLPASLNHFCLGCYRCIEDEEKCPYYSEKKIIADAMEEAELLIFTTPTYCLECSAPMKAFLDLFFYYWIPHRPRKYMFKKKAVIISTAAGTGTGKAIAPVKRALAYWGVPYRKGYGIAVNAMNWEQVPEKKKQQVEKDMTALSRKIRKAKVGKPSPFIRFMFFLMASMKKSAPDDGYDAGEARYWRENGWLDGKRPWQQTEYNNRAGSKE